MTLPARPPQLYDYDTDGTSIYRKSFGMIRAEADLDRFAEPERTVAVRMIHAAGDTGLAEAIAFSPGLVEAARTALRAGAPIYTDATMIAAGITRRRLPADNDVLCTLRDPRVAQVALAWATTRSAAAVSLWDRLEGAVVAIGNAPTALFQLLEIVAAGGPRPAAVIGIPVGFVGSPESKQALADNPFGLEWLVVHGRRGGSALASSAINALAREQEI
ncbi:precorrin-8X methylmutase [Raineyella antarctica]|uniref:Precorrin-8X methylmutase n=1 Tax=Raineyella antarctica TaxID=1577474 RepID=A0A1G6GFJ7_9ACTN|nr:precorrin-8X methylmutase [Raineyella antarctica]SDB80593.1 precorrin-8X methylmutase [Raineyella antarctica]